MSSFEQAVSHFTAITVAEARERIASESKFILFIGRPSCPYCQRFAPKLANVAQATGAKIAYINSEDASQIEDIQAFRSRYGIATVPGLFVAENGSAKVVCDSSLPEEDITDFIS
ncbi:conjugal transfer protein TraF [Streptococcus saliviloxodontae]|uniref:Bacteriocin transport accessory protein n=1 Tax=Streptococcus saliviloxodontae TaxID=1349416 RepID=A0ABS2PMP7_9STRE|nr:conjugal transfer protein TraF [Streptococcus saliviloxodontae]MBM7636280.1 putative bacteriocin transport accessory protein [Streptococcus saliviloxodontae]